jgi:3-methyladenine DNA glycosylase AlkD
MIKHAKYIIAELNKIADGEKSEWWNNYLRNEIKFIGVGMPDNRNIILNWHKSNQLAIPEIIEVANELISQKIAEYKLSAILIYQVLVIGNISDSDLINNINIYFDNGYIFDWNTCDWLCVRILTPIIENGNTAEIDSILNWSNKENYWQARAALVPFTQSKNLKDFVHDLNQPM